MFIIHFWVMCASFLLFPTFVELRGVPSIRQIETTNIRYKILDTLPSAPPNYRTKAVTKGIPTTGKLDAAKFKPSLATFSPNRQEYHWEHQSIDENEEVECWQTFEELQQDLVMTEPEMISATQPLRNILREQYYQDDPAVNSTKDDETNKAASTKSLLSNFVFSDNSRPGVISWNCKKKTHECCPFACCPLEEKGLLYSVFGHIVSILLMLFVVSLSIFWFIRRYLKRRNEAFKNEESGSFPMDSRNSVTGNDDSTIITNENVASADTLVKPSPNTVVFQQNYLENQNETVRVYDGEFLVPSPTLETVAEEEDAQPLLGNST